MDFTLKSINRSTYSILDYLGDIGGFVEILSIIGTLLLSSLTVYNLNENILHHLFDLKVKGKQSEIECGDLTQEIKANF